MAGGRGRPCGGRDTGAAVLADYPKFALRDLRTVILEPAAFFVGAGLSCAGPGTTCAGCWRRWLAGGDAGGADVALVLIPFGAVVTEVFPPRLRGTFGSPNNLALVLERAAPVALALALAAGVHVTSFSGHRSGGIGGASRARRGLWLLALARAVGRC